MKGKCSADEATLRDENIKKKGKLYESKIDNSENQNIMVTSGPFRTPSPKNWIWFLDDRY